MKTWAAIPPLLLGFVVLAMSAYPIWFIVVERPRAGLPLMWFHIGPFISALIGVGVMTFGVSSLRRSSST